MTSEQMRKELIENYGCNEENINLFKTKKELQEYYNGVVADVSISNRALVEVDTTFCAECEIKDNEDAIIDIKEKESFVGEDAYSFCSQDDIFKLFHSSELIRVKNTDAPKVNGLRRVASIVIGPIYNQEIITDKVEVNWDGCLFLGQKCNFKISFKCKNPHFGDFGDIITFADSADCIPGYNATDMTYSKYMTAIATTRAEARVLRKALRLNVVAAEEMDDYTDGDSFTSMKNAESKISDTQIMAVKTAAGNNGIEIVDGKIIAEFSPKDEKGNAKSINDYTASEAKNMLKSISTNKQKK